MAGGLYNLIMAKKEKKEGLLHRFLKGNKQKGREEVLVEASKASGQAMREYEPVFEELAKHDKE